MKPKHTTFATTIHRAAGAIAFLTIALFWTSTVVSELSGSAEAVVRVKTLIPWGFLGLIPALALTGASGLSLSGERARRGLSRTKLRRMQVVAANGLLILAPTAGYLAVKAARGQLDATFYAAQAVELVAGAVNLTLITLNARDGFRMTGRLGRSAPGAHPADVSGQRLSATDSSPRQTGLGAVENLRS